MTDGQLDAYIVGLVVCAMDSMTQIQPHLVPSHRQPSNGVARNQHVTSIVHHTSRPCCTMFDTKSVFALHIGLNDSVSNNAFSQWQYSVADHRGLRINGRARRDGATAAALTSLVTAWT
jgi:hypothetical protein